MGDVVNLNRYRKRKQREAAAQGAAENRVRHGRTTSQRREADWERDRLAKTHEQTRREDGEPT